MVKARAEKPDDPGKAWDRSLSPCAFNRNKKGPASLRTRAIGISVFFMDQAARP
jgi:hypothetical protein